MWSPKLSLQKSICEENESSNIDSHLYYRVIPMWDTLTLPLRVSRRIDKDVLSHMGAGRWL